MRSRSEPRGVGALLAQLGAASLALLCALALAGEYAAAAPADQGGKAPGAGAKGAGGGKDKGGGGPGGRDTQPADGGIDVDADADERQLGTYNPLVIDNPICHESLGQAQKRNCESTGAPEARWPASNYGLEIHIDTGLDNIVGNFQALLAQIANAIWQLALFVLGLVLALLGWAYGLNPFGDNAVLSDLDAGLERFYRAFTSPWLGAGLVALGAWAVYRGMFKREASAAIGGLVLSVVLMIVALAILHNPKGTVGKATQITNDAAVAVISAPQEGGISNPTGSYARATEQVWEAMTLPGFVALNFSNAEWALQKPDPRLLEIANEKACADFVFSNLVSEKKWAQIVADDLQSKDLCSELIAAAREPRTNAEVFLRSSPGSVARDEIWDQLADEPPYGQYLAIQGGGGAWVRLPLVLLIGVGLLGGIALIAWLALRIFVQTAVAFVLVLTSPLALFMPAFGERGRAAFAMWGTTLAGAILSKLVYSALLAVVIFGTTTIGGLVRGGGGVGALMAFLVMAGFWWAVFLKRDDLLRFVSVNGEEGGSSRLSRMAGLAASAYVGKQALGAAGSLIGGGGGSRGADGGRPGLIAGAVGSREDRAEGGRRVAEQQLEQSAERSLDGRYEAAQQTLEAQRGRQAALAQTDARIRRLGGRNSGGGGSAELAQLKEQRDAQRAALSAGAGKAKRAGGFIEGADSHAEATGSRWGAAERAQAIESLRHQANRPVEDPAHAWRVGRSPEEYGKLDGRERVEAHDQVREQLRSDRLALGTIPDRPEGAPSPAASRRFRRQERLQPGGAQRLSSARRESWADRRRPRRGISR